MYLKVCLCELLVNLKNIMTSLMEMNILLTVCLQTNQLYALINAKTTEMLTMNFKKLDHNRMMMNLVELVVLKNHLGK